MTTPTLTHIIALVSLNANIDGSKIGGDTDLESIGFDSLSFVEVAVALAREFGIRTSDEELARCKTVGEMADTVASLAG
jgi:acyl carrier protein